VLVSGGVPADEVWRQAAPDRVWSFPRDHWHQPGYKTEWWYFTGHLRVPGEAKPRFGFQFTFFRIGVLNARPQLDSRWATSNLLMGHAAVTDLASGRHLFSEALYRAMPLLGEFGNYPDTTIVWSRAPAGTPGRWTLTWTGTGFRLQARDDREGFAFDLTATPTKPLVFQGPNGYSRKSATDDRAASLYYSFTRLAVQGRVRTGGGADTAVVGSAWMDREIFTGALGEDQVGWDWLSLQLDDGRDLMLYRLRAAEPVAVTRGPAGTGEAPDPNDGTKPAGRRDFSFGTLVAADGGVVRLAVDDWSWEPLDHWTSPRTGIRYPVRWRIRVPRAGLDLVVEARPLDQENIGRGSGMRYWEGAVTAVPAAGADGSGGRGYVELTGYGEDDRPPL
jgi:predicted secreted hydrolase